MTSHSDMPEEIDFSNATRGKFFSPDARLRLPVFLEHDLHDALSARAKAIGADIDQLANELLRKGLGPTDPAQ